MKLLIPILSIGILASMIDPTSPTSRIRDTTAWVIERASSVSIVEQAIDDFADDLLIDQDSVSGQYPN